MTGVLILAGLLAGYGALIAVGIWQTPRDEDGLIILSRWAVEHCGTRPGPPRGSSPAFRSVGADAPRIAAPTDAPTPPAGSRREPEPAGGTTGVCHG